jgi:uncharacterized Fe-S cluster-containing radical SAM superfamily enzyme
VLDGDKVLHSEDAKVHHVALLTAAEEGAGTRGCSRVLTFRFARRPTSKQWNLRDPYRELLEAEKNYYEEVLPAFRLTGPEAAKIIGDSSVRRGIQSLVGGWFN